MLPAAAAAAGGCGAVGAGAAGGSTLGSAAGPCAASTKGSAMRVNSMRFGVPGNRDALSKLPAVAPALSALATSAGSAFGLSPRYTAAAPARSARKRNELLRPAVTTTIIGRKESAHILGLDLRLRLGLGRALSGKWGPAPDQGQSLQAHQPAQRSRDL